MKRRFALATLTGAVCVPTVALAQDMLESGQKVELAPPPQLGGQLAVDVMPARRQGIGFPLRYGGVIRGSVRVELDGAPLKEGDDYSVDYAGGVIYISARVRSDQSIRVAYRHDPNAAKQQAAGFALPLLSLHFGQESDIQMMLGMNSVSRFADGSMMNSNLAGLKNHLSFGGGSLSGLFLVSSQSRPDVRADSSSPDQSNTIRGIEGTDKLILQKFSGTFDGLKLDLDYQNVGKKFAGFGMLQGAGYDDKTALQLQKEKGLQRYGMGISAGSDKTVSIGNTLKVLQDGDARIEWANYGLKTHGFEAFYQSRGIDKGFTRFADIAEADRDQLAKEKGIDRAVMGAALSFGGESSLKFNQTTIGDEHGEIRMKGIQFTGPVFNLSYLSQNFDNGFMRAKDLAENEREIWARERGLDRSDIAFSTSEKFKGPSVAFQMSSVDAGSQGFDSKAFSVKSGGYGFEYWSRSADKGFGRIGDLPPAEIDAMIQQTLRMYDPNAAVNANDRGVLPREMGMDREFFRFSAAPFKGWSVRADSLQIGAADQGIGRSLFSLQTPLVNFNFSDTDISDKFFRMGDLLEAERNLYGNQIGFHRREWSAAGKLGGSGTYALSELNVDSQEGGAGRLAAQFSAPGIELKAASREVSEGFTRAGSIVDPEAAVFGALVGYNQHDLNFKFTKLKNLSFEALMYGAQNDSENKSHNRARFAIGYALDSRTKLSLISDRDLFDGPDGALYHNEFASGELFHDFGRSGKLTLRHETERIEGSNATKPSRETNYMRYENQLTKTLGIVTEQSRTSFEDGGFENAQSYQVNFKITPRLTLIGTDLLIDRDGAKPDQNVYTYGFSYDFGNNLKIGYNHFRDLDSLGNGKRNLRWDFTNGEYYGMDFGGFYDEKRIDDQRTTALSNFHISNKKPFDFGPMKGVMIKLGLDSQCDNQVIQKENKLADFGAKLFGAEIGASYSHVMLGGEHIGADRIFRLNLDPSGKRPLQAKVSYKVRTLPNDQNFIIRNYDLSYKFSEKLSISHTVCTLPDQANNGVPLGSTLTPTSTRALTMNWKPGGVADYSLSFQELFNWQQHTLARKLECGASLFGKSGSPLKLKYGIENNESVPGQRYTRSVYEISFEQKPGENQMLSFTVGTINWAQLLPDGAVPRSITFRIDYQLKFW